MVKVKKPTPKLANPNASEKRTTKRTIAGANRIQKKNISAKPKVIKNVDNALNKKQKKINALKETIAEEKTIKKVEKPKLKKIAAEKNLPKKPTAIEKKKSVLIKKENPQADVIKPKKEVLKKNKTTKSIETKVAKAKKGKDVKATQENHIPLVALKLRKEKGNIEKPKSKKWLKKPVIEKIKKDIEENGLKETKKGKKQDAVPQLTLENAADFDEEAFLKTISPEHITQIVEALKKTVAEELKKNVLFKDYTYLLNIVCFKVPNCPRRKVKLNLRHSLIHKEVDDILVVVPDLTLGANVDNEPTKQHYIDLFKEAGIMEEGWRLTIMPFNQLRQDFKTFENKRKLAATYDYFLCEGRLAGHATGLMGKTFQKTRTTFHSFNLNSNPEDLKKNVVHALHRTAYKQLGLGNMIAIRIGNDRFTSEQLTQNIIYVVEQLKTLYPGGYPNIRSMLLKIDITGTSSLPLYLSLCQPPKQTPNVVGLREKRLLKLKRKANEVLTNFNVDKKGNLSKLNKTDKKMQGLRKEVLLKNKNLKMKIKIDANDDGEKDELDETEDNHHEEEEVENNSDDENEGQDVENEGDDEEDD